MSGWCCLPCFHAPLDERPQPLSQVSLDDEQPYEAMPDSVSKKLGATPGKVVENHENVAPQFISPLPQQMHQPQQNFFSPGGSSTASSTPGFMSTGQDYMGSMFGRGMQ